MLGHHTGTVPSHSHCNMAYFRITRAEFHVHVPTGSDWIEALWALSTLVFPSPCDSHHAIWCGISTFISGRSVSHTALTSQVIGFVGSTGPATGLNSICNGLTWPPEGALLPAAAQGLLKAPVWEPTLSIVPSPCGCRLELAVGSWCRWWWR